MQQGAAVERGRRGPRPGVEGPPCRLDRLFGILGTGFGDGGDQAAVSGAADLAGTPRGSVAPCSVDEQTGHRGSSLWSGM
jgi:hypothetical protein